MIKVLFVCLGNICRSPLAEGVFKKLVSDRGLCELIDCDSSGTGAYHIGKSPDHRSCSTATSYNITLDHKARQLIIKDLEIFDYIIAMDSQNYKNIETLAGKSFNPSQIMMMRKFDPMGEGDVPDPYYGEMEHFDEVCRILLRSCERFLDYIVEKHDLNG